MLPLEGLKNKDEYKKLIIYVLQSQDNIILAKVYLFNFQEQLAQMRQSTTCCQTIPTPPGLPGHWRPGVPDPLPD